jgi:hypothetical protein
MKAGVVTTDKDVMRAFSNRRMILKRESVSNAT